MLITYKEDGSQWKRALSHRAESVMNVPSGLTSGFVIVIDSTVIRGYWTPAFTQMDILKEQEMKHNFKAMEMVSVTTATISNVTSPSCTHKQQSREPSNV